MKHQSSTSPESRHRRRRIHHGFNSRHRLNSGHRFNNGRSLLSNSTQRRRALRARAFAAHRAPGALGTQSNVGLGGIGGASSKLDLVPWRWAGARVHVTRAALSALRQWYTRCWCEMSLGRSDLVLYVSRFRCEQESRPRRPTVPKCTATKEARCRVGDDGGGDDIMCEVRTAGAMAPTPN